MSTTETRVGDRIEVQTRRRRSRASVGRGRLPADVLDSALARLRFMAVLMAGFLAFSITLNLLFAGTGGYPAPPAQSLGARGLGLIIAIVTWIITKQERLQRQTRCDFGLIFEVTITLSLALTELSIMPTYGIPIGSFSVAAVWIITYRVVVPTALPKSILAAALAAAMVPLAHHLSASHMPAVSEVVYRSHLNTSIAAAVLSVVLSNVVHGLGRKVAEARKMGAYRLDELLGRGGMGEVWRASHSLLKRPAAIKLVRADQLDSATNAARQEALARFEREAQATASLESVHTVQLFDFGTTRTGGFYYVMELLDGLDLDTLVRRHGPQDPARVIHLLAQVCHSLGDAHDNGLIHRDVKPANIFACRLGPDRDFAKVLDFGLVKASADLESDGQQLTRDDVATGTPAYMAPEVALGERNIGPPSDLYNVGCVAYWMLTGSLVFDGATGMAIVSQHIHEAPVPVSNRSEMDVREDLNQLIMDCLAKRPEERPASAHVLRERLLSCQQAGRWTEVRAAEWWRTHVPAALTSSAPG